MNRPAIALVTALLCACTSQIDSVPTPVVRAGSTSPAGIYYGTMTPPAAGESQNLTVLVDEVGDYRGFANDGSYLLAGAYNSTTSGDYTATLHYFTLTAATPVIATMSQCCTFDSQLSLIGQYTLSSGATGTGDYNLTYQPTVYETTSALSDLSGKWMVNNPFGEPEQSFSLDGDGNISGTTASPVCTYSNGSSGAGVATLDLDYNLYSVTLSESCTVAATTGGGTTSTTATLNGLLALVPKTASTPEALLIVVAAEDGSEGRLFSLPASN